jgi:hypothetical protein
MLIKPCYIERRGKRLNTIQPPGFAVVGWVSGNQVRNYQLLIAIKRGVSKEGLTKPFVWAGDFREWNVV